jgi:hypothetical protein
VRTVKENGDPTTTVSVGLLLMPRHPLNVPVQATVGLVVEVVVVVDVAEGPVVAPPTTKPATNSPTITTAAESAITRVDERLRCPLTDSAMK